MPFDPYLHDLLSQANDLEVEDFLNQRNKNKPGQILPSNPDATSRYGGPFATLGTNSNFSTPDESLPQTRFGHAEEGAGYPEPLPIEEPKIQQPKRSVAESSEPKESSDISGDLQKLISGGVGSVATLDNLKKAQAEARDTRNSSNLFKALNLIGAGVSQSKPVGQEFWDERAKQANVPIEELQQQVVMEQKDPNSDVSKSWQGMLTQYGINAEGMSAEQGSKLFPVIYSAFERAQAAKESSKTRQMMHDENMALRKIALENATTNAEDRQEDRQIRRDDRHNKRFSDFSKLLTEDMASSSSTFGRNANIHRAATAIEALAGQFQNPDELQSQEIYEIARNLDAMLSSRAGTIAGTGKLIPSTAVGDVSKIAAYISGIPVGADQGEFVKRLMKTVQREKDLSKSQIKDTKESMLEGFSDLHDLDPNRFNRVLQSKGLPTYEELEEKKSSKSEGKSSKPISSVQALNNAVSGKQPKLIKMRSPDGRPAMVPEDKVQAAIDAGGELAE